jgi:hypothetical protein
MKVEYDKYVASVHVNKALVAIAQSVSRHASPWIPDRVRDGEREELPKGLLGGYFRLCRYRCLPDSE